MDAAAAAQPCSTTSTSTIENHLDPDGLASRKRNATGSGGVVAASGKDRHLSVDDEREAPGDIVDGRAGKYNFTPSSGRRRSLSVATGQPSLETVVVKAKRAASSLWMLLHAQNCAMAGKCPHSGCHEAKMMHLHLKMCPASSIEGCPCPTHYHGCDQARKLLAHHRRCKGLRSRNASSSYCLICSFVARQARTVLERGSGRCLSASTAGMIGGPPVGPLPSSRKHPPPSSSRLAQHTHPTAVSFVVDVAAANCIEASSTPSPPSPSLVAGKASGSVRSPTNGILKNHRPVSAPAHLPPDLPPFVNPAHDIDSGEEREDSALAGDDGGCPSPCDDGEAMQTDLVKPPSAIVLSEPDVASLLCSLAGKAAASSSANHQHRSLLLSPRRRDRAVSSVDSLLVGCPELAFRPLSGDDACVVASGGSLAGTPGRRRSVSLGGEPQHSAFSLHPWNRVEETIFEEGSSQASRESMEPL